MMEQRSEGLVSLDSSLEDLVQDGNMTSDSRDIVMAISRAAKIVSAITRWDDGCKDTTDHDIAGILWPG